MIDANKASVEQLKRLIDLAQNAIDLLETQSLMPFAPGEKEKLEAVCGKCDFILGDFAVRIVTRPDDWRLIWAGKLYIEHCSETTCQNL